jgi:hypothetical protein
MWQVVTAVLAYPVWAALKTPTNSFFLVSTEIAGSLAASACFTFLFIYPKLGTAVGMVRAFAGLAIGLQAVPQVAQKIAHHIVRNAMAENASGPANGTRVPPIAEQRR